METPQNYYNDEVDLREIIRVLLARWRWIAAFTVLSAAVALGVSLLLPKKYQASAYVALTKPDVVFRFDPRITTEVETPAGKGIPDLALSGDVLQVVLDSSAAATLDQEKQFVDVFRERVNATLTDTILELSVEDSNPERAASLANAWAEAVAQRLNIIYAPTSRTQDFFEIQTEEALDQWEVAQKAFVDFQKGNPERILRQQLLVQAQALATYLGADQVIGLVLQDAFTLMVRLEGREANAETDFQDDLTALLLTMQSLVSTSSSVPSNVTPGTPLDLQIQVQGTTLLNASVDDQVQYIEALVDSLNTQRLALKDEAVKQQDLIYDLQGQLEQAEGERVRLEMERNLAQEAFQTLARKAQELSLSAQDLETVTRVASQAAIPSEAFSPRTAIITVMAFMLGFILSVFGIFFFEWWRAASILPD